MTSGHTKAHKYMTGVPRKFGILCMYTNFFFLSLLLRWRKIPFILKKNRFNRLFRISYCVSLKIEKEKKRPHDTFNDKTDMNTKRTNECSWSYLIAQTFRSVTY